MKFSHQPRRITWCLSIGLGLSLLGAACSAGAGGSNGAGGSTSGRSEATKSVAPAQPPIAGDLAAPAMGAPQAPKTGFTDEARANSGSAAQQSAPAPAQPPAQASGTNGQPAQPPPAGQFDQRLIIYNANLRLSVEDVPQAVRDLTQIATSACSGAGTCGFVSESNLRFENDRQVGTITIQVPSERYSEALNSVRGLGQKVLSETSKSQDVTEEFTDQESELRTLRTTEERYLTLLRDARSVQDILMLEDRLRQVRSQIERIQGRINYLQNRAALASIVVELVPTAAAAAQTGPLPEPVQAAQRAWAASLRFLSGAASVLVTVLVFFWWLVPFVIAALIAARVWWTRRRAARPAVAPGGP